MVLESSQIKTSGTNLSKYVAGERPYPPIVVYLKEFYIKGKSDSAPLVPHHSPYKYIKVILY